MSGLALRALKLRNGAILPSVGLGTYQLLGDEAKSVLDRALDLGYRHIDTAKSYNNEKEIGDIIQDRVASGRLKRKDVFITTKVPDVYHAPKDVKLCVDESRENLRLKCLDMVLIHHPWGLKNHGNGDLKPKNESGGLDFQRSDLALTWRALEDLVKLKHVEAIGLSNFTINQMENILNNCRIIPDNVQLECHAYLQQNAILNFCKQRDITLTAYSPLGAPGRPELHRSGGQPVLLEDPVLDTLAGLQKKTKAQILLRWLLQKGIGVVPKSKSEKRLKENMDIFDFELKEDDMWTLEKMDRKTRYFTFQYMTGHPDFDVTLDF